MRFVLRRLGFFVVTLWAAVTLNFLIPRLMPGNAVIAMMSRYKGHVNPNAMHALQIAFGLNTHQSFVHAYFTYLGNISRGRFGISLTFLPDTVAHQVLQALPWTLALIGTTTILAFVLGTLIGLVSAWRRGGVLDGLLPPIFAPPPAFPYFWLALLAIWLFSIKLGWFPESGGYDVTTTVAWSWPFISDAIRHSILPALTLLVTSTRGWNLTGVAMSLGFGVSGAILVEFVFNYPGVGWMFLQSVENQDYALMQGLFLMITVAVLPAILAADGAPAILDPRTRDQS